MMDTYHVAVTYHGDGPYDQDNLVAITEVATVTSCLADGSILTIRCTLQAETLGAAVAAALTQAVLASRQYAPNAGEPVAVQAATEQHQLDQIATPDMPGVMSLSDIARRLGRSRQQVHHLSRNHPDFPTPIAHPSTGPLWWEGDVEQFATSWRPTRGRPSKLDAEATR